MASIKNMCRYAQRTLRIGTWWSLLCCRVVSVVYVTREVQAGLEVLAFGSARLITWWRPATTMVPALNLTLTNHWSNLVRFSVFIVTEMFSRPFNSRIWPTSSFVRSRVYCRVHQSRQFSSSRPSRLMEMSCFTETQLTVRESIFKICQKYPDVRSTPL